MRVLEVASLLIFFAIPLVSRQQASLPKELTYLLTILLLPSIFLNRDKLKFTNPIVQSFALLLVISLFSTIFSIDKIVSLESLILWICYFVVLLFTKSSPQTSLFKKNLPFLILLNSIILTLISFYFTFFRGYFNKDVDGVGFWWVYYGHNHISAILIFALPLSISFLTSAKSNLSRLAYFLLNLFLGLSLLASFGRASMISLIVSFLVALLCLKKISVAKILGITIACFLGVTIIYSFLFAGVDFVKFNKKFGLNQNNRLIYWREAVTNGLEKPLFGSGLNTFKIVNQIDNNSKLKSEYVHNFFLQRLSDSGLFAFLISSLLFLLILKTGFEKAKKFRGVYIPLWISVLALTINSLVDFDLELPSVMILFCIYTGLILNEEKLMN